MLWAICVVLLALLLVGLVVGFGGPLIYPLLLIAAGVLIYQEIKGRRVTL
ncbi:MAG TPA: DUF5670 family protein [Pyrinomonadaceae bacterium]|nr:DUF5670 family protein [Pyrinomonadaceae bacterium]